MQTAARPSIRALLYFLLPALCILFLLRNAPLAAASMREGIRLCAHTVIPSLFPFMVLSELLRASPLTEKLLFCVSRPLCRLLGVSPAGASALLLGLLCGAPVGAQALMHAFLEGRITRTECERLLAPASVPSSAFLISTVGTSLLKDTKKGVLLLAAVLLSALLTALVACRTAPSESAARLHTEVRGNRPSGVRMLTEAVRTSAQTLFTVCAFVLFFAVLTGAVAAVLSPFPKVLHTLAAGILELSSGCARAAMLENEAATAFLVAFSAGWSGLSVHAQIYAVCDSAPISFRPYLLSKLASALLTAALFSVIGGAF